MKKLLYLFIILLLPNSGFAQLPKFKIKIPKKIPGIEEILKKEPPITTSIKDALTEVPFLDDYKPVIYGSLFQLPRLENGEFFLVPGVYKGTLKTYCMHAGTYAPTKGDGYLYAPIKGPQAKYVKKILKNTYKHPEIPQERVQELIWAIIARAKFEDLSQELKNAARVLLDPGDIVALNRSAIDFVPENLKEKVLEGVSEEMRSIFEVENKLREMLTRTHSSYEELERIAVLRGKPPQKGESREIPGGRWSFHPEGFFIRFFPEDYDRTYVEVYVPEKYRIKLDNKGRIVSISDNIGNSLKVEYNDDIPSLSLPWDSEVKAYAISSLKFVKISPYDYKKKIETQIKENSWTFTGVSSIKNDKKLNEIKSEFYDDFQKLLKQNSKWKSLIDFSIAFQRYKKSVESGKEKEILFKNLKKENVFSEKVYLTMVNLEYLDLCIQDLINNILPENQDWLAEHKFLAKKAWASLLCKYVKESESKGLIDEKTEFYSEVYEGGDVDPPWDPSGTSATPGNTFSQRLGQSPSPYFKERPKYRYRPLPRFKEKPPLPRSKEEIEKARKSIDIVKKGIFGIRAMISGIALTIAGGIGFFIPRYIFGKILEKNFEYWSKAIDAIGGDPPRDDYKEFPELVEISYEKITPGKGVSPERAKSLNELMDKSLKVLSYLKAAQESYDRFGGAIKHKDYYWANKQAYAYVYYKRQAGLGMLEVADQIEKVIEILKKEGIEDLFITRENFEKYQARLRVKGFDEEELKAAKLIGFTDEEIKKLRVEKLKAKPEEVTGSIFEFSSEFVKSLRIIGETWASLSPNCVPESFMKEK